MSDTDPIIIEVDIATKLAKEKSDLLIESIKKMVLAIRSISTESGVSLGVAAKALELMGNDIDIITQALKIAETAQSDYNKVVNQNATIEGRRAKALQDSAAAQDLLNSKLRERGAQSRAVTDVKANDKFYTDRKTQEAEANALAERNLLNYAKELDEVNKLSAGIKKQEEAERKVTAALQERGKQRAATDQVKEQEALYVAQKRARDETQKAAIAQTELNSRLKNGTATVKEYVAALKSQSSTLSGQISPKTMGEMSAISGGVVNPKTVEQVKKAMAEIQAITKLSTDKVRAIMREMFPNIDTKNLDIAERKLQGFASRSMQYVQNFINTAIGTLTAMLIFNVTNLIQQFFADAIKAAKDYANATRNLGLTEVLLSKSGMDITKQNLDELVKYIEDKYQYINKIQATDIVASMSIVKDYGLKKEDLKNLADVIAYMQIQAKLRGEEINGETVLNRLMDGRANALNQFGINLSDVVVETEAHRMGFEKLNGVYSKGDLLLATISVAMKATSANANNLTNSLDGTRQGLETLNQKALTNIQIKVGDWFLEIEYTGLKALKVITDTADGFDKLTESGKGFSDMGKVILDLVTFPIRTIHALLIGIGGLLAMISAGVVTFIAEIMAKFDLGTALYDAGAAAGEAFITGMSQALAKFLGESKNPISDKIREAWKYAFGIDLSNVTPKGLSPETPTGEPPPSGTPLDEKKLKSDIEDLVNDLDKLDKKAAEVTQKFNEDWANIPGVGVFGDLVNLSVAQLDELGREVQDHLIDMKRMWEDYQNSISDTVRDFAERRASAERKYRDNERNEEARFQEQMRQLREKFLFSLEDALHERDARQVLRLIKQYEIDKTAATNEHNLARQERARQHAEEMDDLRQQEQDRLQQLAEEYELKRQRAEEDYQLKKERALEEFNAEMEDLKAQQAARIDEFSTALATELGLKVGAADALAQALNAYYGQGGYFDGLYTYSASSMVANAQWALAQVQQIAAQYQAVMASMGGVGTVIPGSGGGVGSSHVGGIGSVGGQAFGGTYFASRPTNATFGERGPELAMFIPLSGAMSSMNKISGNGGALAGQGGGKMEILLTLSPDLEARVINTTMDKTANIIARVNNSKVN